jgi:hypothetical protein
MELEDFEIKVVPPSEETIELEPGLTFCRCDRTSGWASNTDTKYLA